MRLSVRLLLLPKLLPVALLALAAGCGGGEHDAMEKQLSELRAEIARLRAGQAALTERLDTADIERGVFARGGASASGTPQAPPAPRAADRDRPDLDVVRLSPSEGDGDADSDGNRPVIRAAGDGRDGRPTAGKSAARTAPKKGAAAVPAPSKTKDSDPRPVVTP
jgi:hypothetical protein